MFFSGLKGRRWIVNTGNQNLRSPRHVHKKIVNHKCERAYFELCHWQVPPADNPSRRPLQTVGVPDNHHLWWYNYRDQQCQRKVRLKRFLALERRLGEWLPSCKQQGWRCSSRQSFRANDLKLLQSRLFPLRGGKCE